MALEAQVLEAETEIIEAQERRDAARAMRQRDRLQAAGYRFERVVVAAEDDANLLRGGGGDTG